MLSTKGGHPPMHDMSKPRMSYAELTDDIEASRQALGVDTIDLYWLHRDDVSQPVEALLESLESFCRKGWITQYGASNFSTTRLIEAQHAAKQNNLSGFIANQPMGCLGGRYRRTMELPLLKILDESMEALHRRSQLALYPYTSQASGYYEKVARLGVNHPSLINHPFNTDECNRIAGDIALLAKESGHSIAALTLAWWRTRKYPVHPIVGCRTLEQLKESFQSTHVSERTLLSLRQLDTF